MTVGRVGRIAVRASRGGRSPTSIGDAGGAMIIGVPKEVKHGRVPGGHHPGRRPRAHLGRAHRLVERGAGVGSSIPDAEFVATGAKVVDDAADIWAESDMVLGVKEPIAEEYPRLGLRKGQVLFTYLHLAASRPCTEALVAAGNTAIAYETVRLADNSLPLLTPMSEVAGRMAPLMGAHHLMSPGGGRGVLVCGVPGVRSRQDRHPGSRGGRHGRRHPGRRACTPMSTSSTATSSASARSTTTSAARWRRWPPAPMPSRRPASTPTS